MPIPALPLFKHRDTVITPADQNQFVTQFENTMDTLSNGVIPAMNTTIQDINQIEQEIIEIAQNAINVISLDTIEDLATYTGTGLVMVKDINRGGTFVSKTEVDIDPSTGTLYAVNDGTVFAKSGGGFWARQYSGAVNIKWFGAKGDGVTDDRLAIQNAINTTKDVFIPQGTFKIDTSISVSGDRQSIFGNGDLSVILQGSSTAYINCSFSNVSFKNFRIEGGGASGGIRINNNSKHIDIESVTFYQGNQRVWLYACSNISILNCAFINTGYGVIQQAGYSSNNVITDSCIVSDSIADFVEANCTHVSPSKNWTITNNQYLENIDYPSGTTESRFVGITSVENVIISNNIVEKTNGDSAIHLEDTLGDIIISGNIFDNIICTSNDGYIYVLNSSENTIISNNIFKRTDTTLPTAYAYSCGSGYYSDEVMFVNNKIIGNGTVKNLGGLNISYNGTKGMIINSNYFYELLNAVMFRGITNVKFSENLCYNCDNGFFLIRDSSSNGGRYVDILNNTFIGTVGYDIYTSSNTNGTNPPRYWNISGNRISKSIHFTGTGGGINNSLGTISNNIFGDLATYSVSNIGTSTQMINNSFMDDTIITPRSILGSYASDSAAGTAGIPIGGMYRNGSIVQIRVS